MVGEIELAYEVLGASEGPTVLLIAGLGAQLISWDDELCRRMGARGWRVVRYDNRDVGLSTALDDRGPADLPALLEGRADGAAYRLADMARDAVGLLDHLGVGRAHLLGVSMGGMIAQQMAIDHPDRVRSLTSLMSTPGPAVAPPTPEAAALLLPPAVRDAADAAEQAVAAARISGSPAFPLDEERIRRRAVEAFERSRNPAGMGRQLAAILASGDRTDRLAGIGVPTLVVHGDADAMIPVAGGRATADAVPGARLVVIEGMGHDVPAALFGRLLDIVDAFWRRVEEDGR